MCRMLGIVPNSGSSVDPHLVEIFRDLAACGQVKNGSSPGHGEGWGIVKWISTEAQYIGREPNDAKEDIRFDLAINKIKSIPVTSPLIAHLRKASVGSKTRENTHPFVYQKWAFAHNGTIRKLNLKDRTDSEWFFRSLIQELNFTNNDILGAITRRVHAVHETYNYSSITFLLSDGETLYAYRDCAEAPEYYTMYYTRTANSIVICQEKIFDSEWKELQNGELIAVDKTLNHKLFDISEIPANASTPRI